MGKKECVHAGMYGAYQWKKEKKRKRKQFEIEDVLSEEQFLKSNLEFFRVIRFF